MTTCPTCAFYRPKDSACRWAFSQDPRGLPFWLLEGSTWIPRDALAPCNAWQQKGGVERAA